MRRKTFKIIVYAGLFAIMAILATALFSVSKKRTFVFNQYSPKTSIEDLANFTEIGEPEISGWIAWWEETDGFNVAHKHHDKIQCVSPGWLKLDKNSHLVEIGTINKKMAIGQIKEHDLCFYPMLVTDFTDSELAGFVRNEPALENFTSQLAAKLEEYSADGLDLDFENIGAQYSAEFSLLVKKLGVSLKKCNLKFSVTIQAQTGKNDWEGLMGQDLGLISQYADEVRIMAYDRHGEFSEPGPITPMDWYSDVLRFNLQVLPREKIVVGLPTYGYIWQNNTDGFKSFQHKSFLNYAKKQKYQVIRDSTSRELKYIWEEETGWLSDAEAAVQKIETARKMGLNRFVVWNLGGTDENLFEKKWENIRVDVDAINL